MSFVQQVVFIAGGSSGINLGIADAFAAAGAKVAILGRSQDKLDAAFTYLRRHGGEVTGFAADVRDFDGVATALAATAEQFDPVDVVVSGAAGNFLAPVENMSSSWVGNRAIGAINCDAVRWAEPLMD
ncbi:SDR family NAD(P)-dependent oxidoreductase [Pseudomonas aeruginosa]|uniref:SDR family NAD(P)-dependent oxidoreductase n=1 Tax=Pseudomonas aeruginosa TaxID=287 RepID=UPI0024C05D7E|nr:SDR family NAD(P)-dependent oxidoreductase [Pseudomonas aeruginosa]WHV79558.1 SDR family NAD(P)-dependent oxidoreductase [Pseudomonas aeruginosa]